jgi:hypothetical protein
MLRPTNHTFADHLMSVQSADDVSSDIPLIATMTNLTTKRQPDHVHQTIGAENNTHRFVD